MSPNVGWANAVPDANAVANFTIGGEKLQLTGVGYHDKVGIFHPINFSNIETYYSTLVRLANKGHGIELGCSAIRR